MDRETIFQDSLVQEKLKNAKVFKELGTPIVIIAKATELSIEEIVSNALKYKAYFSKNGGITLTGGEPLLQIDFVIKV